MKLGEKIQDIQIQRELRRSKKVAEKADRIGFVKKGAAELLSRHPRIIKIDMQINEAYESGNPDKIAEAEKLRRTLSDAELFAIQILIDNRITNVLKRQ